VHVGNCLLVEENGALVIIAYGNITPGTFLRIAKLSTIDDDCIKANEPALDDDAPDERDHDPPNEDEATELAPDYTCLTPQQSRRLEQRWPPSNFDEAVDDLPDADLRNPEEEDYLPENYQKSDLQSKLRGKKGYCLFKYNHTNVEKLWNSRNRNHWKQNSGAIHQNETKTLRRQINWEDEAKPRSKTKGTVIEAQKDVTTALKGAYNPVLFSFLFFDYRGTDTHRTEHRQWAHQDYDFNKFPERKVDELAVAFFAFDSAAPTYLWLYPGSHLVDIPQNISIRAWGRANSELAIPIKIPPGYLLVLNGALVHMGRGTSDPNTPNPRGHAYLITEGSTITLDRAESTVGRQDPYDSDNDD